MSLLSTDQTVELLSQNAKSAGIQIEVLIDESESFSSSFQQKELENFSLATDRSLGIRVIENGREGSSFTESFNQDDVLATLQEARESSRIIEKNYVPAFVDAKSVAEMPELYNSSLTNTPVEEKLAKAQTLESSALDFDKRIASVPYNAYSEGTSIVRIYNSHGLDVSYRKNSATVYAFCLAKEGDNNSMYLAFDSNRDFAKLDTRSIGITAAEGAIKRIHATQPTSRELPVVLSNKAANEFLGFVDFYFSAKAVDEKKSLFAGKLGQTIASSKLSIADDPLHPTLPGSRPFDSEGAASQKTSLIENGVLTHFLTNSVYAKKLNLPHTANASRSTKSDLSVSTSNLIIEPGKSSFSDLVNSYPEVLVLDEFKGLHAGYNTVSGDFSLESSGVLYKNGQWDTVYKNFVVSGNFMKLLNNIEAVGNDPALSFSGVYSPSILINKLSIAGKN